MVQLGTFVIILIPRPACSFLISPRSPGVSPNKSRFRHFQRSGDHSISSHNMDIHRHNIWHEYLCVGYYNVFPSLATALAGVCIG